MSNDANWYDRINATADPAAAADAAYKKINQLLDGQIAHHKHLFAEEGTQDFDAMKFIVAANFIQKAWDPGMIAAFAVAALYRLVRQQQ